MDSWGRLACYPRRTFYPLSNGASTSNRWITMPCFRTCSTCRSRSQAPFCHCTRQLIANQPEGTFGRLRYILGKLLARQLVSHARHHIARNVGRHFLRGGRRNVDLQSITLVPHCGLHPNITLNHRLQKLDFCESEALRVEDQT